MPFRINPTDFTRIMALPAALRLDALEFLGSTPVGSDELERLLRNLAVRVAANDRGAPQPPG